MRHHRCDREKVLALTKELTQLLDQQTKKLRQKARSLKAKERKVQNGWRLAFVGARFEVSRLCMNESA